MESDNLNQLLVQTGVNENSNKINNLDTEKLVQLRQNFPEFDEFCGYDYHRKMELLYFFEDHNYYKPKELNKDLKFNNLGKNSLTLSDYRAFGLPVFIIISIIVMSTGNLSAISTIIIIILYLLAQLNQYTNKPMQTILKNNKTKEQKIKDIFTQRVKNMHEIVMNSKEDLKFNIKNSIDITGYVDLTKPPPYYFEERRGGGRLKDKYVKIKNNNINISNVVSIHFGYEKYYIIDKESQTFMTKYLKNAANKFFISSDQFYTTFEFLRNFDIKIYLSIFFLVFDFYIRFGKKDKYSIIQRKLISFNKDLNTQEIFEKTKPFRPKLINVNNEVLEFTEEDIYHKADEKEYEEFMNNFDEKFCKEIKMNESLGIREGDILYEEDFNYINVKAKIGEKFFVTIIVTFDAKIKDHTFVWEGNASGRCIFPLGKVELNYKENNNVEKREDGTNVIHIKYVPLPLEVKLLDDFKSFLKYDQTQTIFGPKDHYQARGPYY